MIAVRRTQKVFAVIEVIPIFKERENFVGDRNGADSGSGFRLHDFEIFFLKVDVLFFEVEEFADAASGIYQHEVRHSIVHIHPQK